MPQNSPIFISISGGSGSGKTTFARRLEAALGLHRAEILAQDHYYRDQSERFDEDGGSVNFDHPSAIDFELLLEHLERLKRGEKIEVPRYDFSSHTRLSQREGFEPKSVIILDGTLLLSRDELRPYFSISVYIDTPQALRFDRRLQRDTRERGRCPDGVYKQFFKQVKPMHDQYVEASKKYAQHIVHNQEEFDRLIHELLERLDRL